MLDASTHLDLSPELSLRASPALVAAAQLLALPGPGLEQLVETQLATNPALERGPFDGCPLCGADRGGSRCVFCRASCRRRSAAAGSAPAVGHEALASRVSFADRLLAEVMTVLDSTQRRLAAAVIASLDERGFLPEGVAATAAELGASPAELAHVLEALRQIGPPWVGAANARQCLLLQLQSQPSTPQADLAGALVRTHLEALAHGRIEHIARALDVTAEVVQAAAEHLVATTRPYPLVYNDGRAIAAALPDVAILATDRLGAFEVVVVEARRLRLQIDPRYRKLAATPPTDGVVSGQVRGAERFLSRLQQRWATLRAVTECIVEHQGAALVHGPAALRPLTRAEVARRIGRHESTVSRAVGARWSLLPDGRITALSGFFSASGGVPTIIESLVADEDRPLSDAEIATRLRTMGHRVARRTVAKYRSQLGIPAMAQR